MERARRIFQQGDLLQCQQEAEEGAWRVATSDPELAWQFRLLQAESLLWRGMSQEALTLLHSPAHPPQAQSSNIEKQAIEGVGYARLHAFPEAEAALQKGDLMCSAALDPMCGDLIRAHGVLAIEHGQISIARKFFEDSLAFARQRKDAFMEATAQLNLGVAALREEHFDEAVDWTDAAYRTANSINAGMLATKSSGNLGWAYYNLGDFERSLELSQSAERRAFELGDLIDQLSYLNNAGYVYEKLHDFARATSSYQRALELATQIKSQQHIYNALRALALVAMESGDLDEARRNSDQAIAIARTDNSRLNELYPLLVKGLAAAQSQDTAEAESILREVEHDNHASPSLKWRAEHGLARLYESANRPIDADREYRASLATVESARGTVHREDIQLSFLTNASRIYDDYVHFLVSQGKATEALRRADYSRARTLAQGLRLLSTHMPTDLPPLNAQQVARHSGGNILFYWLGERQSYLWLITPRTILLFPLPPQAEIDAAVQRYRKALGGPQNVLESSNDDGQFLYSRLVAPARSYLPRNAKVFIVPDGSLNNINFETLLVAEPKLHYWIEDVTIVNTSSLRVLAASSLVRKNLSGSLLLIGDSIAPNEKYPELPKAEVQMDRVAGHFSHRHILSREQATPLAYLDSSPDQFSYIHFVAHGTASRISPLDSAIILSSGSAAGDSFKLYARDIIQHHLRANLVTISSCYGAGERAYSGEGLVGLSWAFMRAGAHNVVAALWEATDASTEQLMEIFYDQLDHGMTPDVALRNAKLSLLRSEYHNAFYWGPFQLYSGS